VKNGADVTFSSLTFSIAEKSNNLPAGKAGKARTKTNPVFAFHANHPLSA